MRNYLKLFSLFLLFVVCYLLFVPVVFAVCPVCTVAVCAGIGLSRYLKVDDTISGVWIGGLIISMSVWSIDWLNKKKIHFKFRKILVTIVYYFLTILPLYQLKIIGHPLNKYKLLGIDKLLAGIIFGSLGFLLAVLLNKFLKSKNQGKAFFPFQKVVIPILFLIILSFLFYKTC